MLALLLLLLHAAPPIPPPERDRHLAAIRLWEDHPPPEIWRQSSIEGAVSNVAAAALVEAGLRPGQRRWIRTHDALRQRLGSSIPVDRATLDRNAIACAAQGLAYELTVEEIDEARRFMATPTGSKFWSAAAIGSESLQRCYQTVLALQVSDADFRAVGLRPPRVRLRPGEIVS